MQTNTTRLRRSTPLYEQAYSMLLDLIINGKLDYEENLTDNGLAELLGISRTPVREAVRQLVQEGIFVRLPNRGLRVFNPTIKDIAEIYSIRAAVEGLAARLAFVNPDKGIYIESMNECLNLSKSLVGQENTEESTKINTKFHNLFLEASCNKNLILLYGTILNKVILCRMTSIKNKVQTTIALNEHFEIVDLFSNGTAEEFEKKVKVHVLEAGRRIIESSSESYDKNDPVLRLYFDNVNHQLY